MKRSDASEGGARCWWRALAYMSTLAPERRRRRQLAGQPLKPWHCHCLYRDAEMKAACLPPPAPSPLFASPQFELNAPHGNDYQLHSEKNSNLFQSRLPIGVWRGYELGRNQILLKRLLLAAAAYIYYYYLRPGSCAFIGVSYLVNLFVC